MFDIYKTVKISETAKADVDTLLKETTLEAILEACQKAVGDPDRFDVEIRCYAAALAVVVVDRINAERLQEWMPGA